MSCQQQVEKDAADMQAFQEWISAAKFNPRDWKPYQVQYLHLSEEDRERYKKYQKGREYRERVKARNANTSSS